MQMYELISWFQLNFPEFKKAMVECEHNFDDTEVNPYHIESDVWSHTMMVCKMAEVYEYDWVVYVAALLHDIAKPKTRKINPKNNHVQFFGHEEISVELSKDILQKMHYESMLNLNELQEVEELIAKHSLLHKEKDPHKLFMMFKDKKEIYIHLIQLSRCDALGRFCEDNRFSDEKYKRLLSYSKNMK